MIKALLRHADGKARLSYPGFDEEFTWTLYVPPKALLHELAVLRDARELTYLWVDGDFDWEGKTSKTFPLTLGLDPRLRVVRVREEAVPEGNLLASARPLGVAILGLLGIRTGGQWILSSRSWR